jgi:hypothetical protein
VLIHARARRGVLELAAVARTAVAFAVPVSLIVEGGRSAAVAVPSGLIVQRGTTMLGGVEPRGPLRTVRRLTRTDLLAGWRVVETMLTGRSRP